MSPFDEAKQVYMREPCARSFEEDLELHHRHGFVFSGPDFFIMGRPVALGQDHALILDPSFVFPRRAQNCWLVYLAAGDGAFREFWRVEPYELPYVAFERDNKLRSYPRDQILLRTTRKSA
jgi:hypothetical protein